MEIEKTIADMVDLSICESETIYAAFQKRLAAGSLTRDENSQSHFCVYFLPWNAQTKKVFMVHHKKSDLWLSPGGHIDRGETPFDALNREISEELGVPRFFDATPSPFLLTVTPIDNPAVSCKMHFDLWFLLPTEGNNFRINPEEFHDTKWLTIAEAQKTETDAANRSALARVQNAKSV